MACLSFVVVTALLFAVLLAIGLIQILNSNSVAGEMARHLFRGLIDRTVGRHEEGLSAQVCSEEKPDR